MTRRFRDGLALLESLLDTAERQPERQRVLGYPDYVGMTRDDDLRAFHRIIADAEQAGAVEVRRLRHAAPTDVKFVALRDADTLTRHLRRTPATIQAAQDGERLRATVGALPGWVAAVTDDILAAWAVRREPYPGLTPGDVDTAAKFLRILAAIERGDHLRGWDMRTFSRRACGDSKAVEAGEARLARVLRPRFDLPEAWPRESLAAIGIEKVPQPILLRGPLRLPDGPDLVARPFIGLPPEWAESFSVTAPVPYLLIVENLASFNRHAREIADDGMVLFSAGFPSRATLKAIRHLDAVLDPSVPFFHWGDTDRHGFLIQAHIAGHLERPLHLHLMDQQGIEQEEIDPAIPGPIVGSGNLP